MIERARERKIKTEGERQRERGGEREERDSKVDGMERDECNVTSLILHIYTNVMLLLSFYTFTQM